MINTPQNLATLFALLLKEGITPDQIVVGIIRLAMDARDQDGLNAAVSCLRYLIGREPINASAKGVTEFTTSLAKEGITAFMALEALETACNQCGLWESVDVIRIIYQGSQVATRSRPK
jgi:hypothetical protein